MSEHGDPPNPVVNPEHDPDPPDPRQQRQQRRQRARELEEQAAAARAAAEQARLEAEGDSEEEDKDEEQAERDDEDSEDDGRAVRSLPKGALKLPTFEGSAHMEKYAASFLEEFESYCEFYSVSGKRRLPLLFTCFPLKTPARSWFESQKRSGAFTSYIKFKRMFKEQYGMSTAHRFALVSKLDRIKQTNDINNYYTQLIKAFSDLALIGTHFTDEQQATRFVNGMHSKLRAQVQEQMAAAMALGVHAKFTMQKVYNLAASLEHTQGVKLREPEIDLSVLNLKDTVCHFCKKKGHMFDNCPKVQAKKAAGTWDYDRRSNSKPSEEGST